MAVFSPYDGAVAAADVIEELGAIAASLYGDIELRLMRMIRDAAVESARITGGAVELRRAAVAASLARRARALLDETTDPVRFAAAVIETAAHEGDAVAAKTIAKYPKLADTVRTGFSVTQATAVQSLAIQLQGTLAAMNPVILRSTADIFQTAVARTVAVKIGAGLTINQAQREVARYLLDQGHPSISYRRRDGSVSARMPIGSYAEMAVRTTTANAMQAAQEARMLDSGFSLVEIIVGIGACASCASNAGRTFSLDGRTGTITVPDPIRDGVTHELFVEPLSEASSGKHFRGPNCRCVIVAKFLAGTAEGRRVSTYDPEAESARARLRELERRKRRAALEVELAPDAASRKAARLRVKTADAAIAHHVNASGLNRRRYRESPAFQTGRFASALAAAA